MGNREFAVKTLHPTRNPKSWIGQTEGGFRGVEGRNAQTGSIRPAGGLAAQASRSNVVKEVQRRNCGRIPQGDVSVHKAGTRAHQQYHLQTSRRHCDSKVFANENLTEVSGGYQWSVLCRANLAPVQRTPFSSGYYSLRKNALRCNLLHTAFHRWLAMHCTKVSKGARHALN